MSATASPTMMRTAAVEVLLSVDRSDFFRSYRYRIVEESTSLSDEDRSKTTYRLNEK